MGNKTSGSSLFQEEDNRLVDIWDRLQRYQADFCMALELPHYFTSERWREAESVIDVGTGNGHYLGRVVDLFPSKRYVGVDHSEEFIEIATRRNTRGQVSFVQQDVWNLSGSYDFAILRLVLQHVPDVSGVMRCLGNVVRRGGGALVVDAHDPLRFFSPALPMFMEFMQAFRHQEQQVGPDKTVTTGMRALVESLEGWKVETGTTLTIPSTIPGNMDLFRKTYGLVIDMAELVGEVHFDFDSVRKEWQWWCGLDEAYTHVGLDVVRLERV